MNIKISKHFKGAKSAFSFVFDDGCYLDSTLETIEAFKETEARTGIKIKATSAQTVDFINENLKKMWDKAIEDGWYDVCSHSMSHNITYNAKTPLEHREKDALESRKALEKMYPRQKIFTFVTPGGGATAEGKNVLKKYYLANRSGAEYINNTDSIDWFDIGTFVARLSYNEKDYTDYIDKLIASGGWAVQMNHWITHKSDDIFHAQKADTFLPECLYLAEKCVKGEVVSISFNDAVKYYKERENAVIETLYSQTNRNLSCPFGTSENLPEVSLEKKDFASETAHTPKTVCNPNKTDLKECEGFTVIRISSALDSEIFNHPVTLEISSPKRIVSVSARSEENVRTDSEKDSLLPIIHKDGLYYADVPLNTEILIKY